MLEKEIIALIRLQLIPGLGPVGARNLIACCGSPSAVFTQRKMLAGKGLRNNLVNSLGEEAYLRRAQAEVRFAEKRGARCLGYLDPDYPAGLLQCADSPLVIYTSGRIDIGKHPLVSVVGTRSMTAYGRETCEAFIAGIAPANPIIISGFAYGIDICAQRTAMGYGLQTIAVMAHGLDSLYPAAHRRYRDALVENGGFLTEFPSGTPAAPGHFLRRNRVIAGMSPATVVVESGERGGSLVTADLAFGYDREVFAFPGRVTDPQSAGCNALIRSQKAQLLGNAREFLQAMDWEIVDRANPGETENHGGISESSLPNQVVTPIPDDLCPAEKTLARCLAESGCLHLDDLAVRCQMEVSDAVLGLFNLEMRGLVRCLPGKLFRWGA